MEKTAPPATSCAVFYDGACPLCAAEIAHYRALDGADAVAWVNVADPGAALPEGVSRDALLARFHVADATGDVRSGAAAFVTLWAALPGWRWAARLARLPGVVPVLELGYRLFLKVRPLWRKPIAR
jgi:predicted DCC family thiol-disulfide oxidoreductase YuxK